MSTTVRLRTLLLWWALTWISCSTFPYRLSPEIKELRDRLRCGMEVGQVQQLSELELRRTSLKFIGDFVFYTPKSESVWLAFEKEKLVRYTISRAAPVTTILSTPTKDLCTGEAFLRLDLVLPSPQRQYSVQLDGKVVPLDVDSVLNVPLGDHKLTVLRDGFNSVEKDLEVRGGQFYRSRLVIHASEFSPVEY